MPGEQLFRSVPLWALFLITLAMVLLSAELGYRLGRHRRTRSGEEKEAPVGAMVGAELGLLAFLLAFSFGVAEQRFDVLLTDLRMPVMDGFELLLHCAKLPESHRPGRIIAISGEYDAGVLQGQTVRFLPKPFNLQALLEMLSGKPN